MASFPVTRVMVAKLTTSNGKGGQVFNLDWLMDAC